MAIELLYSRNEARKISQIPDWSDAAIAGDHLWQPTSISGDFCYVGETECSVRVVCPQQNLFITILVNLLILANHTTFFRYSPTHT